MSRPSRRLRTPASVITSGWIVGPGRGCKSGMTPLSLVKTERKNWLYLLALSFFFNGRKLSCECVFLAEVVPKSMWVVF